MSAISCFRLRTSSALNFAFQPQDFAELTHCLQHLLAVAKRHYPASSGSRQAGLVNLRSLPSTCLDGTDRASTRGNGFLPCRGELSSAGTGPRRGRRSAPCSCGRWECTHAMQSCARPASAFSHQHAGLPLPRKATQRSLTTSNGQTQGRTSHLFRQDQRSLPLAMRAACRLEQPSWTRSQRIAHRRRPRALAPLLKRSKPYGLDRACRRGTRRLGGTRPGPRLHEPGCTLPPTADAAPVAAAG